MRIRTLLAGNAGHASKEWICSKAIIGRKWTREIPHQSKDFRLEASTPKQLGRMFSISDEREFAVVIDAMPAEAAEGAQD